DTVEIERLRARVVELETTVTAVPAAAPSPVPTSGSDAPDVASDGVVSDGAPADVVASDVVRSDVVASDVAAASAALGRQIELDDLTVVDGIGPQIAELCGGIGIQTWRDLAQTE